MIEGTKKLKDFKNKINKIHNKIVDCNIKDYYTCKDQN